VGGKKNDVRRSLDVQGIDVDILDPHHYRFNLFDKWLVPQGKPTETKDTESPLGILKKDMPKA
jgi:hypothetical protein